MDEKLFPRESLDRPWSNPDSEISSTLERGHHSDDEIIDFVAQKISNVAKDKS